jgi:hypothetical protein
MSVADDCDFRPAWVGWCQRHPGGPWERVCAGRDLEEVARKLSAALGDRVPANRQAMTTGACPTFGGVKWGRQRLP